MKSQRIEELKTERENAITKWRESRQAFVGPVDQDISDELRRLSEGGATVSELCVLMGTKSRKTIIDYLGVRNSKRLSKKLTWSNVASAELLTDDDGIRYIRVVADNVPAYLWTQKKVPVEEGYSGWIDYQLDGQSVLKSSDRISPLHAENGIKELIAQIRV